MTVRLLLTNSNPKTQQGDGDAQDDRMQQDLNDRQKHKREEEIPVYAVLCHMFLLSLLNTEHDMKPMQDPTGYSVPFTSTMQRMPNTMMGIILQETDFSLGRTGAWR
jgi:hypothetical protein